MARKAYAKVKVSKKGRKLVCKPNWVHLRWRKGPTDIRWAFDEMPEQASRAVVEFHDKLPAKHASKAKGKAEFCPRGVHRGAGHAEVSGASHLPDIVTSGNTHEQGFFTYDIKILDKKGKVLAKADPGGDNGPGPGH